MTSLLLHIVDSFFWVYMIMLFVRILGSWFPEYQDSHWMRFIAYYTDPYLDLFRRLIPPLGMFDLSPIIAFFALQVLEYSTKLLLLLLFR